MRFRKKLLWLVAALFVAAPGWAQCPNLQSVLTVSTGFNPVTNSVGTPHSFDPMWRLIQAPPPSNGNAINIGGPAYVIPQHHAWDAAGNTSEYINAFNTNASVENNWDLSQLTYVFEREFCICDPNGNNSSFPVNFDLKLQADNWAEIYLEDPSGNLTLLYSQQYVYSTDNFRDPVDHYIGTSNLTPGTYSLQLHLRNKQVKMGVALDGTISSNGLLSDQGCSTSGTIAGFKHNDFDQSGGLTPPDQVVAGVTIELWNASGNLVASTTTDQNGFYFFSGIAPGVYTVKEVLTGNWTAVTPTNGIYNNITVNSLGVVQLDFLNYDPQVGVVDPCDVPVPFKFDTDNCQIAFESSISNLPSGWQVVSYSWNFGDGTSSTLAHPVHFYGAAGNYNVCLKTVITDGDRCCHLEYCAIVRVTDECNLPGCELEGMMQIDPHPDCSFDFSIPLQVASVPVKAWHWDFGDGTTGNNSFENHRFPGPGTYQVCVTLFGDQNGDCCFNTICREVTVECDPCQPHLQQQRISQGNEDEAVKVKQTAVADNGEKVSSSRNIIIPGSPCEADVSFDVEISNCKVRFQRQINLLPTGSQIVLTTWHFGDGSTSTEENPTHFYELPGVYQVCVEIVVFNGTECCTVEECRTVVVDRGCEGGCRIEGAMMHELNPENCTFNFRLDLGSNGNPVTTIVWDFGDGTTAHGSVVNHRFPAPGVYMVCVTAYSYDENGECCSRRFCEEIPVDCDPCQPFFSQGKMAVDEPKLTLHPNPNNGQFTIGLEVMEEGPVTVEIIDIKGARVYQNNLGSFKPGLQSLPVEVSLPAGIYVCKVVAGNNVIRQRISIQ